MSPASAAAGATPRPTLVHGQGDEVEAAYASDHWDARRLGVPARRGRTAAQFDTITQPWLRDPVKRWSRFRLATGCAFATIGSGALALSRFSAFLTEAHPEVGDETGITRPVLEHYLSWLVTRGYSASTRALSLSMMRVFFDACHRHGWLPGLAANAVIYVEELPLHHEQLARFIPRIRHEPAPVRLRARAAAQPDDPQSHDRVDRDRTAGRGCLQPRVQPDDR